VAAGRPASNPSLSAVICPKTLDFQEFYLWHGNLLFNNWLNYYVYQETPYNLGEIE